MLIKLILQQNRHVWSET